VASQEDRPQPLGAKELTDTIRKCVSERAIVPTPYFFRRAAQRNFTLQDAINVVRFGEVSTQPAQWSATSRDWSYVICGQDLEGDPLNVVVRIHSPEGQVWLITAY
jgi:hypothetical protein